MTTSKACNIRRRSSRRRNACTGVIMPQPPVASPIQPTDIQLTGAPFIFSTKYIQTASGALNLVETCLAVVLFHSLCSHSEESLSEALFMVSFTYSIAGIYLLLNGTCNQTQQPAGSSRQPSTLILIQLLVFHCAGSIAFLACGCYVLTRHFGVARAIVAGTVSVVQACVHLSHALYIYRGDFQRWLDSV
ncbi:uncharacterized protein [Dermacentor andersoni]|uniref:uncharacterized protein n=1 Tax=Dermacentor andersoni TaxID=34620 RepID=UPI002155EBB1|nr:uncharacterized protein LOC126540556 [Dermacentor andersoni]